MELSFAGCSWNVAYHLGVVRYLQEKHPHAMENSVGLGSSSGCLAALAIGCNIPWHTIKDLYDEMAREARVARFGPWFKMSHWQRRGLELLCDQYPKLYQQATDHLFINVTLVPGLRAELISQFRDNDDLICTMMGSFFIPLYSTETVFIRERLCLDGGFSNLMPTLSENTITVSPVSEDAHIRPQVLHRPFSGFKPRDVSGVWTLCQQGYQDAERFFAPALSDRLRPHRQNLLG